MGDIQTMPNLGHFVLPHVNAQQSSPADHRRQLPLPEPLLHHLQAVAVEPASVDDALVFLQSYGITARERAGKMKGK